MLAIPLVARYRGQIRAAVIGTPDGPSGPFPSRTWCQLLPDTWHYGNSGYTWTSSPCSFWARMAASCAFSLCRRQSREGRSGGVPHSGRSFRQAEGVAEEVAADISVGREFCWCALRQDMAVPQHVSSIA